MPASATPAGRDPPDRASAEAGFRRAQEVFNQRSREATESAIALFRQAMADDLT